MTDSRLMCALTGQNMYEEGDDEMKSTISKAWYESRKKTGAAAPF